MTTIENLTTPEVVKPTVQLELSLEEASERIGLLHPELERRLIKHQEYLLDVEKSIVELRSGTSPTDTDILRAVNHIREEHIIPDSDDEFLEGITMKQAKPLYDELSINLQNAIRVESQDPEYLPKKNQKKLLKKNKGSPPQAAGYLLLKQNCLF